MHSEYACDRRSIYIYIYTFHNPVITVLCGLIDSALSIGYAHFPTVHSCISRPFVLPLEVAMGMMKMYLN